MAVRQVAAVREVQAEDGLARLHRGKVHGHVGGRAGMRLHVRMFGAEQRLGARDRQALDDVHVLAAAVVAAARIAFGVLVREHGAGRFENRAADEVFRRDELEAGRLPVQLVTNRLRDFGIRVSEQPPVRRHRVHRFSPSSKKQAIFDSARMYDKLDIMDVKSI